MKPLNYLPFYHYPTKIIFIDDNTELLQALVESLSIEAEIKIFTSSKEALNYLLLENENGSAPNFFSLNRTLDDIIHNILDNPNRFNETGVILADYRMPEINGLDLCRELTPYRIKKILLSGEADERTAILAFNKNLIDRYIAKQDPFVLKKIKDYIIQLQKNYHQDCIAYYLTTYPGKKVDFMADSSFQEFFNNIQIKLKIVEFYYSYIDNAYILVNKLGTVYVLSILLDKHSKPSFELISPKETLRLPSEEIYYYNISPITVDTLNITSYSKYRNAKKIRHADINDALHCKAHKHKFILSTNNIDIQLTQREAQCLYHLLHAFTAQQIGRTLHISPRTVEAHISNLKNKIGVQTKQEIIEKINQDQIQFF